MKSLCSPALLFLVLMVIGIIMMIYNRIQPMSIVVSALFIVIWTWFLNFLCGLGHEGISWFLVVMPFVLFLVVFSLIYETIMINSLKEKENFEDHEHPLGKRGHMADEYESHNEHFKSKHKKK